ncbi:MAG: hypothetical protein ACOYXT_27595 [Bacteroidota bacterium]
MKKTKTQKYDEEFYVGYFPQAPVLTRLFIQKFVIALGILIVCAAGVVVMQQNPFSTAQFDFEKNTAIEGYLMKVPVPHLRYSIGMDINGKQLYQSVVLVRQGKMGASDLIREMEARVGNADGKQVSITGNLIYGDGKVLLQVGTADDIRIVEGDDAFVERTSVVETKFGGIGEVVDPKCFFGVMKPGEGKPHRSCAIRCIAGGIPPVFHTESSEYFLLVGENYEMINQEILPIVGDRIRLEGVVVTVDDWKILKIPVAKVRNLAEFRQRVNLLKSSHKELTFCY